MSDDDYTNLDLDTAESLVIAAGRPELASALRHHAHGVRNLVQGEWGQSFANSLETILERQIKPLTEEIGGLRGATTALQAEFRTGLSGIQQTVSTLLETVDDLQQQMRESQADRADLRERIDAISTSQAVFTASMLLSAHAVIVIDPQQSIVSVNQKVFAYFGYTADELIGQRLDVLIPKRFRAAHRRHIEAFAASGETQRLMADRHEVYGLHKDGSEFLIRAAIVKVSGGFTAVVERMGDGT